MTGKAFSENVLSTSSLTPLWIPEAAFAVSACQFGLQLLARMIAIVVGLPAEEEKEYVGAPRRLGESAPRHLWPRFGVAPFV